MTQEQDIVERLLAAAKRSSLPGFDNTSTLFSEAAQTIAALRAEVVHAETCWGHHDFQREAAEARVKAVEASRDFYAKMCGERMQELEAAEAKVKELEAEISNLDAELDHWSQLAVDDLGKNPPTSWKEIAETAIRERDECQEELGKVIMACKPGYRKSPPHEGVQEMRAAFEAALLERDEARKALVPFAKAADDLDDKDEDRYELWEHPSAMNITVGDLRRARSASSNREGGEE